jgi:hypothetical protein
MKKQIELIGEIKKIHTGGILEIMVIIIIRTIPGKMIAILEKIIILIKKAQKIVININQKVEIIVIRPKKNQ